MYQLFQDSMAICQFCQKPDIFLTMTANPQWPEVQEALLTCFKIPIPIFDTSFCNIGRNPQLKELIKLTKVIIWDEAPMQHRYAIEALDRTLQDILNQELPFKGLTVLFGGDFRQIPPVIPRGSWEQIINASIRKSRLWTHIQVFHLTQNMWLCRSPESAAFAQWLLEVGEGRNLSQEKTISLPRAMITPHHTLDSLINLIYPNIAEQPKPDSFFLDRTILTTTNDCVDEINTHLLNMFPGEETTLLGFDSVAEDGHGHNDYPVKYLNSMAVAGLPLAHLKLKKGCPLMLLRNMDQVNGRCNGTQMVLLDIKSRVLQCCILVENMLEMLSSSPASPYNPLMRIFPLPLLADNSLSALPSQ
jgi:hypothetical protein